MKKPRRRRARAPIATAEAYHEIAHHGWSPSKGHFHMHAVQCEAPKINHQVTKTPRGSR